LATGAHLEKNNSLISDNLKQPNLTNVSTFKTSNSILLNKKNELVNNNDSKYLVEEIVRHRFMLSELQNNVLNNDNMIKMLYKICIKLNLVSNNNKGEN